jgi:hypothetical protein
MIKGSRSSRTSKSGKSGRGKKEKLGTPARRRQLRGKALMRAVVNHIREHEENWDQRDIMTVGRERSRPFCGTTACVGGWAFILSEGLRKETNLTRFRKILSVGGDFLGKAGERLGLTEAEQDWLFDSNRKFSEVYQFAIDFIKGKRWEEYHNGYYCMRLRVPLVRQPREVKLKDLFRKL